MNAQEAWKAAFNQLELQLDRASFETWLRDATFLRYESGTFVVGVANSMIRDMLQHRLYRNIRRVLSDSFGEPVELEFIVNKQVQKANESSEMPLFKLLAMQEETEAEEERTQPSLHQVMRSPEQDVLPESNLNPRFTFERFLTHSQNRMVYEAARAVSEYPATAYNPFLVYGGVGLGKTHLVQAIAHVCQNRGYNTVYVPSEVFTNDLVNAIRQRTTAMFRQKYRSVDVLIVDDIQFIGGKETTQEEFFHTFNTLVNFNKQIVLASDRHPRELATLEDRLRSRFQGGLIADIQPPAFETRSAIIDMWMRERDVILPPDVVAMLSERAPNNIRELEGVFNQIVAQTRLNHDSSLNVRSATRTLDRYTRPRYRISVRRIIEVTARQYNLQSGDLTGKRRTGKINQARQIAMYLARELTELSLPQIGEYFGGRSHTTVLHGCNKIAEEIDNDAVMGAHVEKIRHILAQSPV